MSHSGLSRRGIHALSAAQIPIAELAAPPDGAYLPRFRALALFGRRSVGFGRRCRRPKTCTTTDMRHLSDSQVGGPTDERKRRYQSDR